MRSRSGFRALLASVLALGLVVVPRAASADWISLSSNTPADPGYMTNSERFWVWFIATGAVAPMVYAGVLAAADEPPADDTKRNLGFALGGIGVGTLLVAFLPRVDPGEPLFTYTLVGGMFMGMAGVGLGGAVGSTPRSLWLGGSTGYGAMALYRAVLSLAGVADYRSGAAAQIVLGVIGTAGCLSGAIEGDQTERYYAYGCGAVSSLATLHGLIMVGRRDPPWPKKEKQEAAFYPVPWAGKSAGGLAIAGSF